jgi:hypothetical protein
MTHNKKQTAFNTIIRHIPFFAAAIDGWQHASQAFAGESKRYQRKQQWKSAFHAFNNPQFASKWFEFLKSPDFLIITQHRPQLYLKPFRVYMSIKWTKKQKIKVILDTYRFIMNRGGTFMKVITSNADIEVVRFRINDDIEGVLTLGYDYKYRKEGELVFSFDCEQLGGIIASAAFSFEEKEEGSWVCRIGCVQGHQKNTTYSSKAAQKLLHGLRPKSLIVITVQEFSRQLGLTAVYGAGDAIQAYRRKHAIHIPWLHSIQFDYNEFWTESGGQPSDDGWYELPLTPIRKDMSEIKSHKRAYYTRRYSLLDDLSQKIADAVKKL